MQDTIYHSSSNVWIPSSPSTNEIVPFPHHLYDPFHHHIGFYIYISGHFLVYVQLERQDSNYHLSYHRHHLKSILQVWFCQLEFEYWKEIYALHHQFHVRHHPLAGQQLLSHPLPRHRETLIHHHHHRHHGQMMMYPD